MSKEAMKLALEALEKMARLTGPQWSLENNYVGHLEALTALREALAEQEAQQEPVAWMQDSIELYVQDRPGASYTIPLYTTPQAQPAPEIAIADAYRAGVDSGIAAERERCCAIVFGLCESDNVAQRTVDAIRAKGDT